MYTSADGNNMRFSITNSFTISTDTNYMRRRREGEREGEREGGRKGREGREEREGGEGGREEREGGRKGREGGKGGWKRGKKGEREGGRSSEKCTIHVHVYLPCLFCKFDTNFSSSSINTRYQHFISLLTLYNNTIHSFIHSFIQMIFNTSFTHSLSPSFPLPLFTISSSDEMIGSTE